MDHVVEATWGFSTKRRAVREQKLAHALLWLAWLSPSAVDSGAIRICMFLFFHHHSPCFIQRLQRSLSPQCTSHLKNRCPLYVVPLFIAPFKSQFGGVCGWRGQWIGARAAKPTLPDRLSRCFCKKVGTFSLLQHSMTQSLPACQLGTRT